jgi:hypothetical protein
MKLYTPLFGSTQRYKTTAANLHNWMKKRGIEKPKSGASITAL